MYDDQYYKDLGDKMYLNVEIKDRSYRFKTYPRVFLGKEAVQWIMKETNNFEISDAISAGNEMIRVGVFAHCLRDHKFKNENLYYRFLRDEKSKGEVGIDDQLLKKANWSAALQGKEGDLLSNQLLEGNHKTDYHLKNSHIPEILIDSLNIELLDNVRPVNWNDPLPDGKYNLVAIGAGSGGLVSALGVAGVGGKSAICEKGMFGGDCLNTGCVPSKALIKAAKVAHTAREAHKYGISTGEVTVDFGKVMETVRAKRAHIGHHDAVERFIKVYGCDIFLGEAKFTSKNTISCNGKTIEFARAVIATGGRPRVPEVPGI